MPLFGSHKHSNTNAQTTGNQQPPMNTNQGQGHNQPYGNANDSSQSGHGTGTGTGAAGPGATDQSYSVPGTQGAGTTHGSSIPPSAALGASAHPRGTGGNFTGKVEETFGSMVGSDALKAKGLRKQQEADAIQTQGTELAEAERLEREAQMRRDRAVAHGAHPDNRHLGGRIPGNSDTRA